MQDHNFEDQVHRKLDDMQLHPSETVWKKVEAQIGRTKKRKRFIIWLPLLLCCFTAGYLYFYPLTSSPKKTQAFSKPVTHPTQHEAGNQAPIIPKNKNSRRQNNLPLPERVVESRFNNTTRGKPVTEGNRIMPNHVTAALPTPVAAPGIQSVRTLSENATTSSLHIGNRKLVTLKDTVNIESAVVAQLPDHTGEIIESHTNNDSMVNSIAALQPVTIHERMMTDALINTSLSLNNPQPVHLMSVKKHFHPAGWEWMLSAAYGKSGVNNSVFSSRSRIQADALTNFSATGTVSNPPPSAIHPGAAFSAGVSVRRQLYRNISWTAGLQYKQFSNYITTGSRDSSVTIAITANPSVSQVTNQYYLTGTKQQYTNRMHFIELPVQLHARLTGVRQLPVYWNIGFTISQLVASNALQYYSGSRVYYTDNTLFNHTQCNVLTGFDMQLFSKSMHPLQLGPQLQYGITRLYTSKVNDNKHLFFYGVKAALLIRQKSCY